MTTCSFGEMLRNARKAQGRKASSVATEIQRDKATIDRWETNTTQPHPSVLPAIATAYGLTIETLREALATWQRGSKKLAKTGSKSRLNPDMVVSQEDLEYLIRFAQDLKRPMSLGMIADIVSRRK